MAANVLVDTSFLIAVLNSREASHGWAVTQAPRLPPPWKTCETALSEAFHLLDVAGGPALAALLQRRAVICAFDLAANVDEVLKLMQKYADVPMSFADACLVRMTETLADPVLLTLDADFRIYRRHGRRIIPCVIPS
jgi:predicted nucleic acid-binding protein